MSDIETNQGDQEQRKLDRRGFLKAGVAAGAGLAALSSPLGARGAALASYSERLARQPLDAATPVNLRFMIRAGTGYHNFFYKAGETFMKQYPNVTIKYEVQDSNYKTKLKVEIAGGVPPDLVFASDDDMFSFAARNTLVDMAPFFKTAGLKRADFYPAAMDPQWLGQHLFAMPLDYGLHVLTYNKELFDRQHQSYPTDKWTWADFIRVGQNLTLDRNGKRANEAGFKPEHVVQYASDGPGFYWFTNILRSNGGDWASADLTKATLDSPAAISTFQLLADLGNKYYTNATSKFVTSVATSLSQGTTAMSFDGTWSFSSYPTVPRLKWNRGNIDVTLWPRGSTGKNAVGAEASGLVIPMGTKAENVKWAWEFIKWMSTEPGQRVAFTYGVASIPNMPKVARELIGKQQQPRNAKILLDALPQAKLPYWCEAISDSELETALTSPYSGAPALYDLERGRKTAAQVMPTVNRAVQAILDRDQVLARKFGAKLSI